jgi:hypothetical protein
MIINLNNFFNEKDCISVILFFTFVSMNRTQNSKYIFFGNSENCCYCNKSLKPFCEVGGFLNFDVYPYYNTFHEKLPIIYANIRV